MNIDVTKTSILSNVLMNFISLPLLKIFNDKLPTRDVILSELNLPVLRQ